MTDFIGRGWDFPLRTEPHGAIATVDGVANLEKAMRIILLTYLGERPMRPLFGSRLRDFLFEGVSSANVEAIGEEVRRALHSCETRARVEEVEVLPVERPVGAFDISIRYTVLATNDERNLVVPFYSIPGEED